MAKQWEEKNQESSFSGEFPAAESASFCHDFHSPSLKAYKEVETDQEESSIGSSSEETESPKSVAKIGDWRKKLAYVHYQIRRIREEDLHLGEDIVNAKEKINTIGDWCATSQMTNLLIFSRPILPNSPLSGRPHLGRSIN